MKKWAYLTVRMDTDNTYWTDDEQNSGSRWEHLDHLGQQGWELVAVLESPSRTGPDFVGYFKRPLDDDKPLTN